MENQLIIQIAITIFAIAVYNVVQALLFRHKLNKTAREMGFKSFNDRYNKMGNLSKK